MCWFVYPEPFWILPYAAQTLGAGADASIVVPSVVAANDKNHVTRSHKLGMYKHLYVYSLSKPK